MTHLLTSESLISLIILIVLEIVLGIDNVIFVSIIMNRLKTEEEENKARKIWMLTGMMSRILLLFGLSWLLNQKGNHLITISGKGFDLASMVMLAGGIFLIYKSVMEIHEKLEGEDPNVETKKKTNISLANAIGQILIIDAVFSFDSIITAGGTAKHVEIMVVAVMIAMVIMFVYSQKISGFIHQHPTLKMLALSFLVMIGLSLIIEGWDPHQAESLHLKNYIYFGMAFSFTVEVLNMVMRNRMAKRRVVVLNEPVLPEEEETKSDTK
jgi:predicted tellurium resistance membrane protein TerC